MKMSELERRRNDMYILEGYELINKNIEEI